MFRKSASYAAHVISTFYNKCTLQYVDIWTTPNQKTLRLRYCCLLLLKIVGCGLNNINLRLKISMAPIFNFKRMAIYFSVASLIAIIIPFLSCSSCNNGINKMERSDFHQLTDLLFPFVRSIFKESSTKFRNPSVLSFMVSVFNFFIKLNRLKFLTVR